MKKLITILIISFLTIINLKANDSLKTNINLPDSTTLTMKEVYTDIKSGLNTLGSALKVGSEHVYEILVKQQFISAVGYSFISLFFIIFILCFWYNVKKANYEEYHWNRNATLSIIYGILSFSLSIAIMCNVTEIITGFFNPEYGAIQQILKVIK